MPAPTLSIGTVTAQTAQLVLSGFAADGTVEIQIATSPDFKNCVCPITDGLPRSSPLVPAGLTQNTSYYARARSRRVSGAAEDWSVIRPFKTALTTSPDTSTPSILISPAMLVVPAAILEWTASNEMAGYPVSNLGFDAPVAWRASTGTFFTGASFTARMAPQPVDTIALLMSNAPEAATVVVQAGTDNTVADYTSSTFAFRASANLAGRPGYHSLIRLPAAQSYEYWKVTIDPVSSMTGPFHLEHAVLGLNRTSKNHSVDKSEAPMDLGRYERDRSGIPHRMRGLRGKRVEFEISMLNQLQFETQYGDLSRLVGTSDPVLVVPNTKTGAFLHDRILYGVLTGGKAVNPASPVYSRSFSIDSILP